MNKMLMRPLDSDTDVYSVYESHEVEKAIIYQKYKRCCLWASLYWEQAYRYDEQCRFRKAEHRFRWLERWNKLAEYYKQQMFVYKQAGIR